MYWIAQPLAVVQDRTAAFLLSGIAQPLSQVGEGLGGGIARSVCFKRGGGASASESGHWWEQNGASEKIGLMSSAHPLLAQILGAIFRNRTPSPSPCVVVESRQKGPRT